LIPATDASNQSLLWISKTTRLCVTPLLTIKKVIEEDLVNPIILSIAPSSEE
jgi:hypothetical protein